VTLTLSSPQPTSKSYATGVVTYIDVGLGLALAIELGLIFIMHVGMYENRNRLGEYGDSDSENFPVHSPSESAELEPE
jgi:hypothetical protein